LKITNHKLCQFIVKKFITKNIDWPREIKIAQKLIKNYPEYIFWNSLKVINLPSLAWFLTKDGENFLAIEKKKEQLDIKRIKFKLNKIKVLEDKKVCQKPKNVLEFIRYGKKT
jgi:hypothetical protein